MKGVLVIYETTKDVQSFRQSQSDHFLSYGCITKAIITRSSCRRHIQAIQHQFLILCALDNPIAMMLGMFILVAYQDNWTVSSYPTNNTFPSIISQSIQLRCTYLFLGPISVRCFDNSFWSFLFTISKSLAQKILEGYFLHVSCELQLDLVYTGCPFSTSIPPWERLSSTVFPMVIDHKLIQNLPSKYMLEAYSHQKMHGSRHIEGFQAFSTAHQIPTPQLPIIEANAYHSLTNIGRLRPCRPSIITEIRKKPPQDFRTFRNVRPRNKEPWRSFRATSARSVTLRVGVQTALSTLAPRPRKRMTLKPWLPSS